MNLFLFLLLATVQSQLLSSLWVIESNSTTDWQTYGLTQRQGLCSWAIVDQSQNIELVLYEDISYSRALNIKIYLNYSINKAYPFYDGQAHIQYLYQQEKFSHSPIKKFDLMPYVYIYNSTLMLTQNNSTIIVDFKEQQLSILTIFLSIGHLIIKAALFSAMIISYRRTNTNLSMAFLYVIIGWELQAHISVIKMFEATRNPDLVGLGVMIGLGGWLLTLASLIFLPRPLLPYQQMEGLIYYLYECTSGSLFPQSTNVMLYAISPLLQLRFNVCRNVKNSVCPYAISIYLINIFFIYFFKACPSNLLRYSLDLPLCIKASIVAVILTILIYLQGRQGPLLCARELINGKDYKYLEEISLSEGEQMIEDVCAICLQPITTEALVQQIEAKNGGRYGKVMKTPCGHRYHPSCLRQWLQQKNTCPMDNQQIPPCFE